MPWQAELSLDGAGPQRSDESCRSIALADRIVPYTLRRSRRRSIGLTIDQRGLRIHAPTRVSLGEIEATIHRHAQWVADKLDLWRERRRPVPLRIADGAQLPYLGATLTLRLACGANRAYWHEDGTVTLTLATRGPDDAPRLLERALRARALALFRQRREHFAAAFGVAAPPLSLSAARTRWGSCSLLSGIRLNWRLIYHSLPIIDYVVVHELAHLEEMNHSPRFWAIVARHCPDHRARRAELRRLSAGA